MTLALRKRFPKLTSLYTRLNPFASVFIKIFKIFLSLKKYKNFFAHINEKKYGMACELTELNGNFLICYRFQYIIKRENVCVVQAD
ncbi:TPA: hypothetical protein U2B67_001117 [Streptococcus suis]|nr:hypothetical protein [Streptococcus suis]HEM6040694.1 hypothetical protein [Streptococcus suis]HEM6055774.1 hypothetical protein [Streptococcus suis]HEM6074259.1 hypothetical protein [Streptococcus suis]HEM6076310.1 hypothetical protein [Streptococcus suis]